MYLLVFPLSSLMRFGLFSLIRSKAAGQSNYNDVNEMINIQILIYFNIVLIADNTMRQKLNSYIHIKLKSWNFLLYIMSARTDAEAVLDNHQ